MNWKQLCEDELVVDGIEVAKAVHHRQRALGLKQLTVNLAKLAVQCDQMNEDGSFSKKQEKLFAKMQIYCNNRLKELRRPMITLLHLTPTMLLEATVEPDVSLTDNSANSAQIRDSESKEADWRSSVERIVRNSSLNSSDRLKTVLTELTPENVWTSVETVVNLYEAELTKTKEAHEAAIQALHLRLFIAEANLDNERELRIAASRAKS